VSAPHGHNDSVDIVVVTGMSGSGKSTALAALEDDGYYCIDNLPSALVVRFVELCNNTNEGMTRVALGLDCRDESYTDAWPRIRSTLEDAGHRVTVIFVTASDDVLLRRFSETRRPHPGDHGLGLEEALAQERESLSMLSDSADINLDTSDTNVHELKANIAHALGSRAHSKGPALTVKSFGFRHGPATDADLVFDVRFVPNPYFVDELKPLSGLDEAVSTFVLERADCSNFLVQLVSMLSFLLPRYAEEGKAYITIAIGCTGGRHRSVAIAEELVRRLSEEGYAGRVRHRDIDRNYQ